jgi:hypothetical protein
MSDSEYDREFEDLEEALGDDLMGKKEPEPKRRKFSEKKERYYNRGRGNGEYAWRSGEKENRVAEKKNVESRDDESMKEEVEKTKRMFVKKQEAKKRNIPVLYNKFIEKFPNRILADGTLKLPCNCEMKPQDISLSGITKHCLDSCISLWTPSQGALAQNFAPMKFVILSKMMVKSIEENGEIIDAKEGLLKYMMDNGIGSDSTEKDVRNKIRLWNKSSHSQRKMMLSQCSTASSFNPSALLYSCARMMFFFSTLRKMERLLFIPYTKVGFPVSDAIDSIEDVLRYRGIKFKTVRKKGRRDKLFMNKLRSKIGGIAHVTALMADWDLMGFISYKHDRSVKNKVIKELQFWDDGYTVFDENDLASSIIGAFSDELNFNRRGVATFAAFFGSQRKKSRQKTRKKRRR